jgi:glucose/arabinose dehydrogenase
MSHRTLTVVKRIGIAALVACACEGDATAPSPVEHVSRAIASDGANFTDIPFVTGLAQPSQMTFTPDGRLLVCENTGNSPKLRVIKNAVLLSTPMLTLSSPGPGSVGERGLLGVEVDPSFAVNGFVYVYYTVLPSGASAPHNRISRFTASGDVASASSEKVLLELENLDAEKHNGGGLHFAKDGTLYIGVGDNDPLFLNNKPSQRLDTKLGKLLRINPTDGSAPSDNPFFKTLEGDLRTIWAVGLRNPYTFAFKRTPDKEDEPPPLFINDVGNNKFEEIDLGKAGANYDWPNTEGPTTNIGTVTPTFSYVNDRNPDCAIVGGTFYDPVTVQFPANFVGQYFFADYCGGWIKKLDPGTHTVSSFATQISSPVDLDVGPDGALYYLARGSSTSATGMVGRILFAPSQPPTITATNQPSNVTVGLQQTATFSVGAGGSLPLSYQWQRNGVDIATNATSASYTTPPLSLMDNGAIYRVKVTNAFGNATSDPATLTVLDNHPPSISITDPPVTALYSAGETITYKGLATDPEKTAMTVTWQIDFHHANHVHPFIQAMTTTIDGGTFKVPLVDEPDTNVWYRIYLTVTDHDGLVSQVTRDIHPRVVNISVEATDLSVAESAPALQTMLNGIPVTTRYSVPAVVGQTWPIAAPPVQAVGGVSYSFFSWSDGGAIAHLITIPTADVTFTAGFKLLRPFLESGGQVVMEAENFAAKAAGTGMGASSDWVEQPLSGASGTVLTALPDNAAKTDDTTGPRRDYPVRFATTGTYRVWVRLSGPNSGSDSIHMGFNGTLITGGGQGFTNGATLAWKNTVVGTTPITVNVTAPGVNTVNLWMREDGCRVDKIILTKSTTAPLDAGPAESPHDNPTPAPTAPTLTTANGGILQASLAWTDSNNETLYRIERKVVNAADSTYARAGTVGANTITFTDTSVPAGTYTYRVKASNAGGATVSNTLNATVTGGTPLPPVAPDNLVVTGGVNQASLSWADHSSDETGFKIERKLQTSPDTSFAQIVVANVNATTFLDPVTVTVSTDYSYRVRATNANGDSAYTNVASATVVPPATAPPPSAPTLAPLTGGVSQARLDWTDSDTETSFKIERKAQGAADGTYAQVGTVAQNVLTFTNLAVPAGMYTYRVKASSAAGDTVSTNTQDFTVTAPAAPTALTATGGVNQATLNWTDATGDQTGFRIERKGSAAGASFAQVTTVAADVRMFVDSSLAADIYTYQVKAINPPNDSAPSAPASATVTGPAGPAGPSGLIATSGNGQVSLTWVDHATNETGFTIERKLTTAADTSFAPIATAGVNAQSFTNTVAPGNYSYRVRATNANGDSAYSNVASATSVGIANLVVNDTALGGNTVANNTEWTVQANLQLGVTVNTDRTLTLSAFGNAALAGKPWIRSAGDSKSYASTNPPLGTFTVFGSFVDLLVDDRLPTAFLVVAGNQFTDTGVNATIKETATLNRTYSIWRKAVTSGSTVTLPTVNSTTAPCYFVVVE